MLTFLKEFQCFDFPQQGRKEIGFIYVDFKQKTLSEQITTSAEAGSYVAR